jgi:hypothetical protein
LWVPSPKGSKIDNKAVVPEKAALIKDRSGRESHLGRFKKDRKTEGHFAVCRVQALSENHVARQGVGLRAVYPS